MKCMKCGRDYSNAYTQCMTCGIPLGPRGAAYLEEARSRPSAPMSEYERQLAQGRTDIGMVQATETVKREIEEEKIMSVVVDAKEGFLKPKWDIIITNRRLGFVKPGSVAKAKSGSQNVQVSDILAVYPINKSFTFDQITQVIIKGKNLTVRCGNMTLSLVLPPEGGAKLNQVLAQFLGSKITYN